MPKFTVEKAITVNVPLEKVYQTVTHFEDWIAWSPWLLMEPEAKVEFKKEPEFYSWEGQRVGSGNMEVLSIDKTESSAVVTYALNFLKPWKSYADVQFILEKLDDGSDEGATQVKWTMDSSLPFFLFWMKKMMVTFIGMDYQRGLNMLKEHLETGNINSAIELKGEASLPETQYIGITTQCTFDDIGKAMGADFEALEGYFADKSDLVNGLTFSIYHKWNMSKQLCDYTAAIPVKSLPDSVLNNLPSNMKLDTRPEYKVFTLRHTGDYAHLGNAWTTLYTMQRNKEIACLGKAHPFEVYVNNPNEVEPSELVTDLMFPVK
jgi:effector-binding domain-containing protein